MLASNTSLHYYDLFPKMVKSHNTSRLVISPRGSHVAFSSDECYTVVVLPLIGSHEDLEANDAPPEIVDYDRVTPTLEDGKLVFSYPFGDEQEYYIRLYNSNNKQLMQLSVYALDEDLFALRPYRGDLHVHTCFSDGREAPEYVAAVYRQHGFDFLSITDHRCYESSVQAVDFYKDLPIDLTILPGEEVHMTGNHIHIVNAGSSFSINKIGRENSEQYFSEVKEIEKTLGCPEGVHPFEYAACTWIYNKIREGGGLAIFAHPHWLCNVYHVKDVMTRYQFETSLFDAFELLGGQTVLENNMQVALYHDLRAEGHTMPIVGSSDSHGVINNFGAGGFKQISTICFARENTREALFDGIKGLYSVAVESCIGEQVRAHGSYRMVSYALFLLNNYFPLHDDLCHEEGRLMLEACQGMDSAADGLARVKGRTGNLMDRCFGV